MKYELICTWKPDANVPSWTTGDDRLSYPFTNPNDFEITDRNVKNGWIARYVSEHDFVERFDTHLKVHIIYNDRGAAESRSLDSWVGNPDFISFEVVDRPDL
jgi:hypothetical protein